MESRRQSEIRPYTLRTGRLNAAISQGHPALRASTRVNSPRRHLHSNITRQQRFRRRCLRWFNIVLNVTGCLAQTILVSQTYFSYPTTTLITIEPENELKYPAITFCFDVDRITTSAISPE